MTQTNKRIPSTPKQAGRRRGAIDAELDAALFKALGDPTRIRLLSCLAKCGRGCSVSEIAECCPVDISVVSRHLALLARAGIVEPTREGRVVRYHVRYPEVCATLRRLADALEGCCPDGCCR